MKQYKELLQDILDNGEVKDDRTGVGTYSVFGRHVRFDLRRGFPAVTTKKLAWKKDPRVNESYPNGFNPHDWDSK